MDFQGRMRRMTVLPGSIVAKAVHGPGIAYLWPCFMAGAVGGVYLQPAGRFRTPHKNHIAQVVAVPANNFLLWLLNAPEPS